MKKTGVQRTFSNFAQICAKSVQNEGCVLRIILKIKH